MYIIREKYLIKALEWGKTRQIVLLSGLRGSGKTSLLTDIARSLRRDKPPVRVVEVRGGETITSDIELLDAAHALGAGVSALIVDNAELIDNLLSALREIHKKYKTTVYLSGQKTVILEDLVDQCTSLSCEILRIHPFSYKEFLEHQTLPESRSSFMHYLSCGGLPQSLILPCTSEHSFTVRRISADSFLLGNIIERFSVRNPFVMRLLLEKMVKTQGAQISTRTISESFAARRITVSNQTVIEYLEYCRLSGLLEQVPVIDCKTGKIIEAGSSWYFMDNGLRSAFASGVNTADISLKKADTEKAFENALYIRLLDEGYSVVKGRAAKGKDFLEYISFVCTKNNKKIYLQISPFAAGASAQIRKRQALLAVRDAWPKYLIGEEDESVQGDGIISLSVRKILYEGIERSLG